MEGERIMRDEYLAKQHHLLLADEARARSDIICSDERSTGHTLQQYLNQLDMLGTYVGSWA